ncbi:hypothetical protein MTR_2g083817 [Medicago truncatula]|uniref:Uncharacterized protein n=1 Tax=Medicago truncatula TaxID=3880 RepID=A0A072VBT7_MEDTR|nr:hypothetical protein MTR_2g083817 [Medicago truncatula]
MNIMQNTDYYCKKVSQKCGFHITCMMHTLVAVSLLHSSKKRRGNYDDDDDEEEKKENADNLGERKIKRDDKTIM